MRNPTLSSIYTRCALLCALACFIAKSACAVYIIPYELRLGDYESGERFTVLVCLADHHGLYFGEPDQLSSLLARNYYRDADRLLSQYLEVPQEWYLDQIEGSPRIYGADSKGFADKLRKTQHVNDGRSSVVVITRLNRLDQPLAMIRVATSGPDGKIALPSEANYLVQPDHSILSFPETEPEFRWAAITDLQGESYLRRFFTLQPPLPERQHLWLEGENIEMKNFSLDPATGRKFFRHLYFIMRLHKMFHFGGRTFPRSGLVMPDGSPVPENASTNWGRRVSTIWLSAFHRVMEHYYRKMGFRPWNPYVPFDPNVPVPPLNNEHTMNLDLFLMRVTPEEFDAAMQAMIAAEPQPTDKHWLLYQPNLAAVLSSSNCGADLIKGVAARTEKSRRRRSK